MSTLSNSVISIQHIRAQFLSGSSAVQVGSHHSPNKVFFGPASQSSLKLLKSKRPLTVKASGDGGRSGAAGVFVSGFVLGGLVVGALGAIYAPQISKALAGTDRKEIMRKLPKFIYDEEKALEKTRKILTEKIEQLNSAIDTVSAQLRADNSSNGAAVTPDELEASI